MCSETREADSRTLCNKGMQSSVQLAATKHKHIQSLSRCGNICCKTDKFMIAGSQVARVFDGIR